MPGKKAHKPREMKNSSMKHKQMEQVFHGQNQRDTKHGIGQYSGAGEHPKQG